MSGLMRMIGQTDIEHVSLPDHILQLQAQREDYAAHRGTIVGRDNKLLPRVTVRDAKRLIEYWTAEGEGVDGIVTGDIVRWAQTSAMVLATISGMRESERFPEANLQELWDGIVRRAIALESVKAIPSRWDLIAESISESVRELPSRLLPSNRSLLIGGGLAFGALILILVARR